MKENKEKIKEVEDKLVKAQKTGFKDILSGRFLSRDNVTSALPFIFFLTFLGICYIANGYQAEKLIRQLYNTNNELKELRSEYITTKSELMYISKQSQVAKATEEMGLKELTSPPKKIIVSEKEIKELSND